MNTFYQFQWIVVFAFTVSINVAQCQKILFEVDGPLKNLSSIPIGDSILLSYDDKIGSHKIWITDSIVAQDNISHQIFAGVNFGSLSYLYYADGNKRSTELNALVKENKASVWGELDSTIVISGYIIANYVDGKNIVFILLGDEGKGLSFFEVNRLRTVGQNRYLLPNSILDYISKDTPAEFYSEESEINLLKGRSKVKIFKYDKLYVTVDQPFNQITQFFTIDPATKIVTSDIFKSPGESDVSSYFKDGKLFQTSVRKNRITLTIYDINSKEVLAKKELTPEQTVSPIYFNYSSKNVIHSNETANKITRSAGVCEPIISVCKKGGVDIIRVGTYYSKNQGMVFVPAAGIVGIAASLIGSVILQSIEGSGVSRYFYYSWDEKNKLIAPKDQSIQSAKEKIDKYEIEQRIKNIGFDYKLYSVYREGILCTYYSKKTEKAWLIYFE